jgi:glycerophosphoryl diester phosphodiesterase
MRFVAAVTGFFIGVVEVTAAEIIAHRGASYDAPENTLAAMRLAWEQNTDSIETDLWLSKDGKIVVLHDADTKRVGGTSNRVAQQTWTDLQKVDVGAWKHPQFAGERIPVLQSILATVPKGRRAILEIKCGVEILPELERVIGESGRKPEELAIISFKFSVLKESKKRFPKIEHYYLYNYKKDPETQQLPTLARLIEDAKSADLDGLDLHFDWPIDKAFVARVKEAGLKLIVWTINDPAVARRMSDAGVDGITTDRPGWLREQLKR